MTRGSRILCVERRVRRVRPDDSEGPSEPLMSFDEIGADRARGEECIGLVNRLLPPYVRFHI